MATNEPKDSQDNEETPVTEEENDTNEQSLDEIVSGWDDELIDNAIYDTIRGWDDTGTR